MTACSQLHTAPAPAPTLWVQRYFQQDVVPMPSPPLCMATVPALTSILRTPGLERCQALLSLDVTGNQLASLEGLRGCILLERLNAAHNALRELDWHHLPLLALGSLDLSSNRCRACLGLHWVTMLAI